MLTKFQGVPLARYTIVHGVSRGDPCKNIHICMKFQAVWPSQNVRMFMQFQKWGHPLQNIHIFLKSQGASFENRHKNKNSYIYIYMLMQFQGSHPVQYTSFHGVPMDTLCKIYVFWESSKRHPLQNIYVFSWNSKPPPVPLAKSTYFLEIPNHGFGERGLSELKARAGANVPQMSKSATDCSQTWE